MDIIEYNHVYKIYDEIANNFSNTRYSHWNYIKNFLENIQFQNNYKSKINFLDFGCGNGKYLSFCNYFNTIALDNSQELLNIVKNNYPNVKLIKGDVCDDIDLLELEQETFDYIISIAVIHHLYSEIRRIQMLNNIIKLLKPGGICLISAWANNISKNKFTKLENDGDYLIPLENKLLRYYHLFDKNEFEYLLNKTDYKEKIIIEEIIFECNNWIIKIKKI